MNGIVLIGHGSIKSASGAAMIRLTARLREQGVAAVVEAGFLNYSRPTLAEAIEKCVSLGVERLFVQPYFLIDGVYVQNDLAGEIAVYATRWPGVRFVIGYSFGDHWLMGAIALDRVRVVDPSLDQEKKQAALLLMAHGTPDAAANAPLERIAERLGVASDYCQVTVSYLDCNEPTIPTAIDGLVENGAARIVALPYFLHKGRHVRDDLPRLLAEARQRHPALEITEAAELGYDLRLAELIAERVKAEES
ncbi:MAG: sirohydrochlorin chelatase [Chloroflexi bacterium]|nr:sirohydrochlorin chelatase [Chloroflexota bacterium]